jgi:hypothetical protein
MKAFEFTRKNGVPRKNANGKTTVMAKSRHVKKIP